MKYEEIIAMARQCGCPVCSYPDEIVRFAALVAAKEREACILEIKMHTPRNGHDSPEWFRMNKTIDEIRARGQK